RRPGRDPARRHRRQDRRARHHPARARRADHAGAVATGGDRIVAVYQREHIAMTQPSTPAPRLTPGQLAARDLRRSLRKPGFACLAVVGGFFGVFGLWAGLAPISSAAVATGVVSPEGSRKTIQHLEGGIIKTLHVREGDRVKAGDLLTTL